MHARFLPARPIPRAFLLVAMLASLFLLCGHATARAATLPIATDPAANATIGGSPATISVGGADAEPAGSSVTVYDSEHHVVAHTYNRLMVTPPQLAAGAYTVVWRIPSAGATGSSTFLVDPSGASPTVVREARPDPELASPRDTSARWLALTSLMFMLGALGVRFLVSVPSARRLPEASGAAVLEVTDRRLARFAAIAALACVPLTCWWLTQEAAGSLGHFLVHDPDGRMWLARLVLIAIAALALVGVALRPGAARTARGPLLLGALVAGVLAFLTIPLPTDGADYRSFREVFTALLDWGHLLGSSFWIGGIAALVALTAMRGFPVDDRRLFWSRALRRFSALAMVCVGVMILTGLWTAWVHVGRVSLLFTTLYGQTLLVKLVLVAALVGIGAFHQLWLLPRIDSLRDSGAPGSALAIALRDFRRVVVLEAVIGTAILFIVPFLSSSARNQHFQANATNLTQTHLLAEGPIGIRPSGLRPGLAEYDITTPPGDPGRVSVSFSSPELGVPPTTAVAALVTPGHYRVTGAYTAIVGTWQARVSASGTSTTFDLPVTAEQEETPRAPQPGVSASTWAWGSAAVIVVVGGLVVASRVTSRVAGRRRAAPVEAEAV